MSFIFFLLFITYAHAQSVHLPQNWPVCPKGPNMNECLKNAIQIAINDIENGKPELGIIPLDPWVFRRFDYDQKSGLVAIRAAATDISTTGFKNTKIHNVKTDWKTMDISLSVPSVTTRGTYDMNGTMIFLPVSGRGKYSITFDKFSANVRIIFDKYMDKGEEYLKIKGASLYANTRKAKVQLTNLFNGNKFLGDRTNEMLNKNWRVLFDTLAPLVADNWSVPIGEFCNEFFSKVPLREFVPK